MLRQQDQSKARYDTAVDKYIRQYHLINRSNGFQRIKPNASCAMAMTKKPEIKTVYTVNN